ncbi:MAG: Lrp/AsnC ligand binding domain-containing protein [Arenibacterium sp.]
MAGEDCYPLKIRADGTDALNVIIEQQINTVQSVTRARTTIVHRSVNERVCLSGHALLFLGSQVSS